MLHRAPLRSLLLILCMGGLLFTGGMGAPVMAQPTEVETLFDDARIAWDEGDYPEALQGFQAVLDHADGERFFEDIALITGKLYASVELAADGTVYTYIVDVSDSEPATIDRFEGEDFTFAPDGETGTYLRIQPTDTMHQEMQRAAQQLQDARQQRDRAALCSVITTNSAG